MQSEGLFKWTTRRVGICSLENPGLTPDLSLKCWRWAAAFLLAPFTFQEKLIFTSWQLFASWSEASHLSIPISRQPLQTQLFLLVTSSSWVLGREIKTHNVLTVKGLFGPRHLFGTFKMPGLWGRTASWEVGFIEIASTPVLPSLTLGKQTRVPVLALPKILEQPWHKISLRRPEFGPVCLSATSRVLKPGHFLPINLKE